MNASERLFENLMTGGASEKLVERLLSDDPYDKIWRENIIGQLEQTVGCLQKLAQTDVREANFPSLSTFFHPLAAPLSEKKGINIHGKIPFHQFTDYVSLHEILRMNVVLARANFQAWVVTETRTFAHLFTSLGGRTGATMSLAQCAAIIDQETYDDRLTLTLDGKKNSIITNNHNWFVMQDDQSVVCLTWYINHGWICEIISFDTIADRLITPGDQFYTKAL